MYLSARERGHNKIVKFATEATITETCETTVIVIVEHLELLIQEIKYAKLLTFPQE